MPFFIVSHDGPAEMVGGDAPFTFVDAVEDAIEQAHAPASGKDVNAVGADVPQQAIRVGPRSTRS